MAVGLEERSQGTQLITDHPEGLSSSSIWFHNEDRLDFNMMQTGTRTDYDNYRMVIEDYSRA